MADLPAPVDITTSVSRPASTASIASRCPGRNSEKPNASRATRSIFDSSARSPRVTGMDQPWSGRKLHFVGVLGAGMSGLARVATILGAEVTGSDRALHGHDAANVPAGAEVVYSSAVAPENPERTTGAPELHRADLLGELTRLKPTIAVSGTHGKTTTTSMIVHALENPSYLVGGDVRSTGTNADWTDSEWLVVEADEADRRLLKAKPTGAGVTNAHHPRAAHPPQRRGGAEGARGRGPAGRQPRGLPGRRAAVRGDRHLPRGEDRRRLRPPPDRGRRDARSRAQPAA